MNKNKNKNKNEDDSENDDASDDDDDDSDSDDEKEDSDINERHYRHTGGLQVDWGSDTWIDWDQRCHGKIDSNEMRRTYPEGFTWTCCGKLGQESGCESSSHSQTPLDEKYPISSESDSQDHVDEYSDDYY